jgi:hypothetical protein
MPHDLPDWYMPPPMIGGHVVGPVLIGQSEQVVAAVRQILAYPTGVEVELEAHARGPSDGGTPHGPLSGVPDLRCRLRLADGSVVIQDDDSALRNGRGPTLVVSRSESSSGGPDHSESVRLTLWMSPLPPPGPLTLTCSWPRRGLEDASVVIDADAMRTAATQARPFWPADQ